MNYTLPAKARNSNLINIVVYLVSEKKKIKKKSLFPDFQVNFFL